MASIIRVKRSTGTSAPGSLQYGELAYTVGVGTFGNSGSRLFIGDTLLNPLIVGGKYYTDLLGVGPGLVADQVNPGTTANGFVPILDENRKVDQWNVDNLRLDGNTLSSQDTDGDILLDPNGTGDIQIPDDTSLVFGTSKDTSIHYDEAGNDRLEVEGADWYFASGVSIYIDDTTSSSSVNDGALVVRGGVGIGSNLYVGYDASIANDLTVGAVSDDGIAKINTNSLQLDIAETGAIRGSLFASASDIVIGNTVGILTIRNALVDINGDLNISEGDLTADLPLMNVFTNNVNQANVLTSAYDIVIGAQTGITTIRNSTLDLDGDLNIDGGDITSNQSTFNFLINNVTNANLLESATNIFLGATSGIVTVRNNTVEFDNSADGSYVSIAATTAASSTTTGALRVAGGVGIASDVYIGGSLYVDNDIEVDGNFDINGGLDVDGDFSVDGNVTLGNSASDAIYITGITTVIGDISQTGAFTNSGGAEIDEIIIRNNVISTKPGSNDTLYIDPYPDGLSNEGIVVIKGDLQVDGTTTSVNSNTVTVDDPILELGKVFTTRTVMSPVVVGVNTIRLDSVVGLSTNDTVTGSANLSLSGISTITVIDEANKIITIQDNTVGGIGTGTQLTIQASYDTNTDRGISFNYNTGTGVENNKIGFFGYVDFNRHWTYIPEATITNSVVSGVKGTLDVGALFLDWGVSGISTRGVSYFDSNGKLISTNSPEIGYASTSNYILTTDASNIPVWTDTLDGGEF
jgi:cytoskeletal protein CcmA (bactofilin family)